MVGGAFPRRVPNQDGVRSCVLSPGKVMLEDIVVGVVCEDLQIIFEYLLHDRSQRCLVGVALEG